MGWSNNNFFVGENNRIWDINSLKSNDMNYKFYLHMKQMVGKYKCGVVFIKYKLVGQFLYLKNPKSWFEILKSWFFGEFGISSQREITCPNADFISHVQTPTKYQKI